MRKDRLSFISGFMPPVCMMLMLGFEYLPGGGHFERGQYAAAAAEIIPFLLPLLFVIFLNRAAGEKSGPWACGFSRKAVPFVILMSVAAALLSFLLNSGVSLLLGEPLGALIARPVGADTIFAAIVLAVVLPGVFQELLFRGGLLSAFSSHGTACAIFLSAATFALVRGNACNLAGPFASGMVYGYMAYSLGSAWPAVAAHMVNNTFLLTLSYVAGVYDTLGIWPYFMLILVVAFGLFLYLSMRSLEKLIEKGKVRRFHSGGVKGFASGLLFTPGLWLLGLMYIIRIAYS